MNGTESFAERFKANPVVSLFVKIIKDNDKEKYLFNAELFKKGIKLGSKCTSSNANKQNEISNTPSIHICADITVYNIEEKKEGNDSETTQDDAYGQDKADETAPTPEIETTQD